MSKLANKIAGERERERSRFTPRPPRSRNAKPLDDGDRSARLIASTAATSFRAKGRSPYADFFFGFGLVAFGMTGASGVPSIEDRRPAVKV